MRLAMASKAATHFPPVEKADTVPELKGWGLVSDARGTNVGGRVVMTILSLGAGAKAMPGWLCLRVHFGSYLHAHRPTLTFALSTVCSPALLMQSGLQCFSSTCTR